MEFLQCFHALLLILLWLNSRIYFGFLLLIGIFPIIRDASILLASSTFFSHHCVVSSMDFYLPRDILSIHGPSRNFSLVIGCPKSSPYLSHFSPSPCSPLSSCSSLSHPVTCCTSSYSLIHILTTLSLCEYDKNERGDRVMCIIFSYKSREGHWVM